MTDQTTETVCLACGRDIQQTPPLASEYRESQSWICPKYLPVLIHNPQQLVGRLPGAESLSPAERHD